ncbi:hypothetical protein ACJIZ3_002563 [Penstemon smallii]|uniref:Cytochrome P450 n=1 Tax=Penstemon smallii TaxID=265156 RepID=A0ABD3U844_9LAMI
MTIDFLTLSLVFLFFIMWKYYHGHKKSSNFPPGPFPLPIIGNILQLGQNPHQSFAKLSKIYGPLMHLKFGSMHTIVVSSPEMAKELIQKHDLAISTRAVPEAARALNHHTASLAWLPIGSQWRTLRKICNENMFSTHSLDASQRLRLEKLQQLRDYVQGCCNSGRVVNIGEVAFVTSLNSISSSLFSIDFANFDTDFAQEMKEAIQGVMKILGTPNLADYFPVLSLIDPQGIKRETEVYGKKILAIFDEIISQRLKSRCISSSSPKKDDFLEVLLDLHQENESKFSFNDIKHLLIDLFVAGTDTSTDTVQWAMTELIRNPDKMLKAKNEISKIVGENKQQVEESDISKLPYLRAVIKETFRYHPVSPFLVPHKAKEEIKMNGHIIPKNAQVLVNLWAIGRDTRVWPNANSFEPERFLDNKIDYKGRDFELIAFGSGRRMCPGMPLAHRMVHLMVAHLIHNFNWKLEPGPKELDMSEKFGLSLHKTVPLMAIPFKP